MGIFNPSEQCSKEYDASLIITEPLANCISTASIGHSCGYFYEIRAEQFLILNRLKFLCILQPSCPAESRSSTFFGPCHCQRWLSALPLSEYGFTLHNSVFHDAVASHYGQTPYHCACGTNSSIEHVLSSPKGDLSSLCHNEIRDLTANLLTEVCHQVHVEPKLQCP